MKAKSSSEIYFSQFLVLNNAWCCFYVLHFKCCLGIVTRRPLVLQLHKIEEGLQDHAEFLHLPKKRFTDFCMSSHAVHI